MAGKRSASGKVEAAAVKADALVRFDVAALREHAGAKVFVRGAEYCDDGCVHILSIDAKRVIAHVAGSETYRTVLTGRGAQIGGHCSCPAFRDWFCKHMVAVALTANAAGKGAEAETAGARSRIRNHLIAKGIDALVDMILDLAEEDDGLFRKLDVASVASHGDDKTLEARLRKAIDAATRTGSFIDYREARHWRQGVESVLDAVAGLVTEGRASVALRLVERAIEGIEATSDRIDDSDGHLGALLERARDVHLAAVGVVRPDPVALARDLFGRVLDSDFEPFFGAAELYADVLGQPGLAEYRRLAVAAWDKLPVRSGKLRTGLDDGFERYSRLKDILDFFAERDGDVDARIALRAKDLSSQWSYLQLAEFCLSEGRKEEALRRAEEGLWLFEDERPDERLLFFIVKLLSNASRKADAEAHLRRAFEKDPSLEIYKQLRKLGGIAAGERAVAFLEARLAGRQRTFRHGLADLLVAVLMHEKRFDAAWSAAAKFGASVHTQQELARASDQEHAGKALPVYAAQVEHLAGSSIYEEAVKVIGRMGKIRPVDEQAAYVAELKLRHGRKRNFMKLLA